MGIGIFLSICMLIVSIIIALYKNFTVFTVKLLAFGIDFFVLVFYAIYFFHPHVAVKIAHGNWIYALDVLVAIMTVILYAFLIQMLNNTLPIISNILNLFMAFVGVSLAVQAFFGLLTPLTEVFHLSIDENFALTQNHMMNLFIKYAILVLFTLPVWRFRMDKLEEI